MRLSCLQESVAATIVEAFNGGKGDPMAIMMNQGQNRPSKIGEGPRVAALAMAPARELNAFYAPLVTFLLVSVVASSVQSVRFFSLVPEGLKPLLGDPPAAQWVSLTLAIYFVSMLVINVHGIYCGGRPGSLWLHVACRCTFYLLYFIADALPANLLAVLLAGLILLAMEFVWARINERRESWGHC
jgi:hypothetical protein